MAGGDEEKVDYPLQTTIGPLGLVPIHTRAWARVYVSNRW